MADPGSPSWTVPTVIASDTNYPAGTDPWSGQAMKVAPITDYFTPGETEPAEYMNKRFFDRDTADTANLAYLTSLKAWLGNGDNGPSQLNYVADITALKAVTGMAHNDAMWVESVGTFGGGGTLYRFSTEETVSPEVSPHCIIPTAGGGRWKTDWRAGREINNGVAGLNSSGMLTATRVPDRIYATTSIENTAAWGSGAIHSTASTTYVATGFACSVAACAVGDIVMLTGRLIIQVDNLAVGEWIVKVNGSTDIDATLWRQSFDGFPVCVPISARHVVASAGTVSMEVYAQRQSGSNNVSLLPRSAMAMTVIRP